MQSSVLAEHAAAGVRLVISVDTGVRAFAAADEARKLSLDLIVTDHHLPDADRGVPDALAVLNPNQPGCTYPAKDLCGAGVAFKLSQALLESAAAPDERDRLRNRVLPSFLKMLAIATIADSVPLDGENRAIVAIGLRELLGPSQPGLRELMRLADLDPASRQGRTFTTTEVGFRLAPRINAAGRMDNAADVVEMFLTRDAARAIALASRLNALNEERRATELSALTEIENLLATHPEIASTPVVVLQGETWHRGVVGILASRVVDRTYRPALVFTNNPHNGDGSSAEQEGVAHGSGRSIAGFHLLDALTAVDAMGPPLFTRFGGHAYAVGCSMPSVLVDELRSRLTVYAADHLTPEMLTRTIECHAELPLDQISPNLFQWFARFEPTGAGNPAPVFVARNVRIAGPLRVIKEKHLKLRLEQNSAALTCMAWSWAERAMAMQLTNGSVIDIAYTLRQNTHPDFGGLELELVDLHLSEA
jgi:single-stranded-DNA-specific exonuclease